MKELQEFFKDIKRIANAVENIVSDNRATNDHVNAVLDECKNVIDKNEPVILNTKQFTGDTVTPTAPVQESPVSVQNNPVPTGIPVSNVAPTYTQDQLAVAMGRAIDMGKMADIQIVLSTFNVSSLMEIPADKYNDLALKLREIGVEV